MAMELRVVVGRCRSFVSRLEGLQYQASQSDEDSRQSSSCGARSKMNGIRVCVFQKKGGLKEETR